jgi:hypothetical protein
MNQPKRHMPPTERSGKSTRRLGRISTTFVVTTGSPNMSLVGPSLLCLRDITVGFFLMSQDSAAD